MQRKCAYCGGVLHSYEKETDPDFPGLEFCDEPCRMYFKESQLRGNLTRSNHDEAKEN